MKFVHGSLFGLTLVVVSGCFGSKAPSESDVEKGLVEALDGCRYVSVFNVKKINAVQNSDIEYLVKTSFDVAIKPMDKAKKAYKEAKEQQDAADKSMQLLKEEEETLIRDYTLEKFMIDNPGINQDEAPGKFKRALEDAVGRIYLKGLNIKGANYREIGAKMGDEFSRECPSFSTGYKMKMIFPMVATTKDKPMIENLSEGVVSSFTQEIIMRKSENGWVALNLK